MENLYTSSMTKTLASLEENGFIWIDVTQPDRAELQKLAQEYKLEEASVQDCLQSDHLPKIEKLENYSFIIFRVHNNLLEKETNTVQQLTTKLAIFLGKNFIITVHRLEMPFIADTHKAILAGKCRHLFGLLNLLIKACLSSYDAASVKLNQEIDYYEEQVFLRNRKAPILKGLYYLHRKIALVKRLIILSYEIVDTIDNHEHRSISTRDTRDLYIRVQSIYDSLHDNINQLLNVYFSTASQRTNEIMRVLTILTVFFMPLTFIVGVYGMNFKYMPELDWIYGYPTVIIIMVLSVIGCYVWFKKKGWM